MTTPRAAVRGTSTRSPSWHHAVFALAALLAGAGCPPSNTCADGEVERGGACYRTCNNASDCARRQVCTDGVCEPAEEGTSSSGGATSASMAGSGSAATSAPASSGVATGTSTSSSSSSSGSGVSSTGGVSQSASSATSGTTSSSLAASATTSSSSSSSSSGSSSAGSSGPPPNRAPTFITLTGNTVAENLPAGTMVGRFTTMDPDAGDTFTYTLAGADAAAFSVVGDELFTAAVLDREADSSLNFSITSTDQGGLAVGRSFTVTVTNVDDPPVLTVTAPAAGWVGMPLVVDVQVTDQEDALFNCTAVTMTSSNAMVVAASDISRSGVFSPCRFTVTPRAAGNVRLTVLAGPSAWAGQVLVQRPVGMRCSTHVVAPAGTSVSYPCVLQDPDAQAVTVTPLHVARCAGWEVQGDSLVGTMGSSSCDGFIRAEVEKNGVRLALSQGLRVEPVQWAVRGGNGVRRVAVADGGAVIAAGSFTSANPESVMNWAVLDETGARVPGCNVTGGANGAVYTVLPLDDGTFFLGGFFTSVGGVPAGRVARVDCSGSQVPGFRSGAGFNNPVQKLRRHGEWLYVVGNFTQYAGTTRGRVARLRLDGTLDETWPAPGSGFDREVMDVAVDDSAAWVSGDFTSWNGSPTPGAGAARILPDGTLDPAFVPALSAGNGSLDAVALAEGGTRLYVASRSRVFKLDAATGAHAPEWPSAVACNQLCASLQVDAAGVWVGSNTQITRKFSPTGTVLVTLPEDVQVLALSGGWLYVAGQFPDWLGTPLQGVARLSSADGTRDVTFVTDLQGTGVKAMAVDATGRVVVGGSMTSAGGHRAGRIIRFDVNGDVVPGSPFLNNEVLDLVRTPDGDVLVAGPFTQADGNNVPSVLRLGPTLSVRPGFLAPAFNNTPRALALSGGHVLVGGAFTTCDGASTGTVCRLDVNTGQRDPLFGGGGAGVAGEVVSLDVAPEGIYASGSVASVDGVATGKVVRLTPAGLHDPGFTFASVGTNRSVNMARSDGTRVVVGTANGLGYGGTGNFSLFSVDLQGALAWSSTSVTNASVPYVLPVGADFLADNKRLSRDGAVVATYGSVTSVRHADIRDGTAWLVASYTRTSLSATLSRTLAAFDAATGTEVLLPNAVALAGPLREGILDGADRMANVPVLASPYTGEDEEAWAVVPATTTTCAATEPYMQGPAPLTGDPRLATPGRYRVCGRWTFGTDVVFRPSHAFTVR